MKLDSSISAIVTGGASGLGAATVRRLAEKGVKIAIFDLDRQQDKADELLKEFNLVPERKQGSLSKGEAGKLQIAVDPRLAHKPSDLESSFWNSDGIVMGMALPDEEADPKDEGRE